MKKKTFKKTLSFIIPIIILLIISLLNMYGASFIKETYKSHLIKQTIWIIIGLMSMTLVYKTNLKILFKYSGLLYILGIISLILVLFLGSPINGAKSWFKIGPVSFQPSELFKFIYILYLTKVIKTNKNNNLLFLKILLLTFIPAILIFMEPDTGVVLMYILLMFGFIIESNIDKKYIYTSLISGGVVLAVFFFIYFFKSDIFISLFGTSFFYRMDRILSFKNNTSYQLNNALIGIGSSGPFGLGLKSTKIYIPEITTDFAFTLVIINMGYLVGILVVLIYIYILYIIYREIYVTYKLEYKLILSSTFYLLLYQILEHILMNIGLTPITGITLPFISYGGSSLISSFMIYGLILNITTKNSSYTYKV